MLMDDPSGKQCFEDWQNQKLCAENRWQDIGLRVEGEVWIHKMRDSKIYAVAHEAGGGIFLARMDRARKLSFEEKSVLNPDAYRAVGTVSVADFKDGRVHGSLQCGFAGAPTLLAVSLDGEVLMRTLRGIWTEWRSLGGTDIETVRAIAEGCEMLAVARKTTGEISYRRCGIVE